MQKNKLYVGNLPWEVTPDELKEFIQSKGDVVDVKIIEGKGFGFVEMSSTEEVEQVKNDLNGQEFKGRRLRIDNARPQRPRTQRDGGSGGGGFQRRSSFKRY
ncbi:RNA recognition motif domain-containing protein [bacterium]